MKAGTAKLLKAGLRVASAQARHQLNGERIRQALVVGSAATSAAQARKESRRDRNTVFHEYCCGPHSLMGREASKRGYRVQRGGEFTIDVYTPQGVRAVHQHICRDLQSG